VAALRRKFTDAAQDHSTEHYFVHKRALCVAEAYANATEPSKRGPGDHDGIHQKGAARASPACGRWCCGVRTREKRSGRRCSPHEEEPGEFTSGGEATVRKLVDGGKHRRKQGRGILVQAVRATKKKTWSKRNLMSNRHITSEGKEGGRDPSPAMESSDG
jgi:hypothetical protein